jgi:hypothetical protein
MMLGAGVRCGRNVPEPLSIGSVIFQLSNSAQPSPWLSYIASGNWWELEAQTIRIDGGAIEEEIRIVWGVLKRWLVFTLLRLQRR